MNAAARTIRSFASKDRQGNDKVLIERGGYIIAWEVWSPRGDKIAFLKGDPSLTDNSIWIINPDGTGLKKISGVDWDYPPVWSADGSKLIFTYGGFIWAYDVSGTAKPSQEGGDCSFSSVSTSTWKTYKHPGWEVNLFYPPTWQLLNSGSGFTVRSGGSSVTMNRDVGFSWDANRLFNSCDISVAGQKIHILTSDSTSSQLLVVGTKLHTYDFDIRGPLSDPVIDSIILSLGVGAADMPSDWVRYFSEDWNLVLWHPPGWQVTESPGTAKQGQELSQIELSGGGCDVWVGRGYLQDVGRTPTFSVPFYGNEGFGFFVTGPAACSDIINTAISKIPPPPPREVCNLGPTISTSSWASYGDPQFSGPINLQYPSDWQVQNADGFSQVISHDSSSIELWGSNSRNAPSSGNYKSCELTIGNSQAIMWEENLGPKLERRIDLVTPGGTLWAYIHSTQSDRPTVDTILKTMQVVR